MSTTKELFFSNLKQRLGKALLPEATPQHPGSFQNYSFQANQSSQRLLDQFTHELEALSGHAIVSKDNETAIDTILKILKQYNTTRILAWNNDNAGSISGLNESLAAAGISVLDGYLPHDPAKRQSRLFDMENIIVGITGTQGGLADTGSIALISGQGQGRLASILPPVHIAILSQSRLYPSLPAFLSATPSAATQGSNLVFITGPSRTGDIEMTLSLGVHGPGEVYVIVVP